ncbi:Active breakpoint cluster region-related protein [Anabarilius grahami]|uniref:Active breakpoint cluster region-related protein n=1 Tax=Anabarilius grahami TaxID=495550 RepID=A0A3N0YI84_ANAGA|nr:Active breakpoint cluster region-related protein [Anabarilius grahami]
MELYREAIDYLNAYGISPVTEEEMVDSDLLQDVFTEETEWVSHSPLQTETCLPSTPTTDSPDDLLQKRMVVLKGILISEEIYLTELETLLTPMKALRAAAGTSQPVLSTEQVQTVFYQIPELRDLHKDFCTSLRTRLQPEKVMDQQSQQDLGREEGPDIQLYQAEHYLSVGDLFLKFVNQLGVYRGFIDNYENAVEIVQKCMQSDQRFRTLAESMMSSKGSDNVKTKYTFEALLYKPLDRVMKTTLVLHDLLKHTPPDHPDSITLQEALRLTSSFLSGVNERSNCKRAVMLSRGERRQLLRDGFVVDVCESGHNLRHLFLYTDMLLCAKLTSAGRQAQYRFCWYLPLVGLKLHWAAENLPSSEYQMKISKTRAKMHQLKQALQQHMSHTIRLFSLYDLNEWKEAIEKQSGNCIETVPPDLLSVTGSCIKLRMTQQPPLNCIRSSKDPSVSFLINFYSINIVLTILSITRMHSEHALSLNFTDVSANICGSLYVMVQSACGLQHPSSAYVCVEVDGFEFYDRRKQTCLSAFSVAPQWDEELVFQVDRAQQLFLVFVSQNESDTKHDIVGRAVLNLDPDNMLKKWKKVMCSLGQVDVNLSIKYVPHLLEPPSSTPLVQEPVFCVPIEQVAMHESVLVPHIVRSCVEEVERRGLNEEGIYRISGASSEIQALKHAFNTNYREAVSKLRSVDVNAVSGTLKLYFRELPLPLIPSEQFKELSDALDIADPYLRADSMLTLLQDLPDVNRNTLLFLLHHLRRVAEKKEENKMSLSNLATVFGPSLLRPPVARVDISQEVEVQVQVIFLYLQCQNLPEALLTKHLDIDELET